MTDPVISPPFDALEPPAEAELGYSSMIVQGGALTGLSQVLWSRRTGIVWNEIERTIGSGIYDWDNTDEEVVRAVANNYSMIFVIKVGHPQGHVDEDCYDSIAALALGFPFDRLYSCPINTTSQIHFKNFIRAFIRRYGFGTASGMSGVSASFQLALQIENEASSKKFWSRHNESDGALAAQTYVQTALKPAYEAKQLEGWTGEIILAGLAVPENAATCFYDFAADGYNCGTPANIRQVSFIQEVLKYPQYFDAIDLHLFSYQYFLPRSIDTAVDWVESLCRQSGYSTTDKGLYSLEWTPAFVKHAGARNGGPGAMAAIYPYAADLTGKWLDPPTMVNANGDVDLDETNPPCYFSGYYSGTNGNTIAVAMRADSIADSPQTYRFTMDYQGDGIAGPDTTWSSRREVSETETLMGGGISVTWNLTDESGNPIVYTEPFGLGSVAHNTGAATNDTLAYYYENLDFLETWTDPSIPAAIRDSKHRKWFELEEGADFLKAICGMVNRGITRFSMVKWPNYYPGFSWDERWWKFHGMIRLTGSPSAPVVVKKPSWYSQLMWETYLAGYTGVNPYNISAGVTCYQFNYANGIPRYVMWATPTNTLDDPAYDGGDVVLTPVALALANLLGWTTAIAREVVTALDGSNNPVYTTDTVSGASTVTIGNIPKIVIKVA